MAWTVEPGAGVDSEPVAVAESVAEGLDPLSDGDAEPETPVSEPDAVFDPV